MLTDIQRRAMHARSRLQVKFLQERRDDQPEIRMLKRAIHAELRTCGGRYEWSLILRELLTVGDGDSLQVQHWKMWARAFRTSQTALESILADPHTAGGVNLVRVLLTLTVRKEDFREIYDAIVASRTHHLIPPEIQAEFNRCRWCRDVTAAFLRFYFMTEEEMAEERTRYLEANIRRSEKRAARWLSN